MANEERKGLRLNQIGEHAFLHRVRQWFGNTSRYPAIELGVGDDAAILSGEAVREGLVVSADALVENVHFRWDWTSARDLGHKALAVNLSDLAAMGALPVAAFMTLSVPGDALVVDLERFFHGLRVEGGRWGCPLAGGDLTRGPLWCISITVLGAPAIPQRYARRDAARHGDDVYVTGSPGESGAGLETLMRLKSLGGTLNADLVRRHRRPTPRLREGAALMDITPRLAMIDVSDGIYNDAGQIATASGVGIELELERIPVSRALMAAARDQAKAGDAGNGGKSADAALRNEAARRVLFGGEDYELIFTTSLNEQRLRAEWKSAGLRTPLHRIGRVREGRGVTITESGRPIVVRDRTFRHF